MAKTIDRKSCDEAISRIQKCQLLISQLHTFNNLLDVAKDGMRASRDLSRLSDANLLQKRKSRDLISRLETCQPKDGHACSDLRGDLDSKSFCNNFTSRSSGTILVVIVRTITICRIGSETESGNTDQRTSTARARLLSEYES